MKDDRIEKIYENVSELKSGQARLEVHIDEIKKDIRYHIKRTDLSEKRIERIEKLEQFVKGAIWIIFGSCSSLYVILKIMDHLSK